MNFDLMSFRIAGRRMALPLSDIRQVLPVPLLGSPLGAPAFVEGFFDFQGVPVACVRAERLLGLEEEHLGIYAPLLLLAGNDTLALHVGKAELIIKTSVEEVQPIGEEKTFNGCVAGRIGERGETIYVLSRENLLLAAEREAIAAHDIMRQRRLDAVGSHAVGG
jgi:purine-binding chemotaxis protein CheW